MIDDKKDIPRHLFEPASAGGAEGISRPALSYGRETVLRIAHDPVAVVCICLLALIALGAILIPLFSPLSYAAQDVVFANRSFFSVSPTTGILHLFGTDYLGRDLFIRIWYGARISLTVAVLVACIDCVVGVLYGGVSGYLGGGADNVMMRVLEIISGIPYLVVVLLFLSVMDRGLWTIILAYSLVGWTGTARLVRGEVIRLKNQEFCVAAHIMGAGMRHMLGKHLLPNLLNIILVNIMLDIPGIIFTEAFLSMMGLGIAPPYPSWGVLAKEGIAVFQTYPLQLAVPALFICTFVVSFNLLGDRLQDAFDPKRRKERPLGRHSNRRKSEPKL